MFLTSFPNDASLQWCSVQPGIPFRNVFWTSVSMYLLPIMKESHRFLRMEVNTFPTQEVSAMGLKLHGSSGKAEAELLGISRTSACFHACRIEADDQLALHRSQSAGDVLRRQIEIETESKNCISLCMAIMLDHPWQSLYTQYSHTV